MTAYTDKAWFSANRDCNFRIRKPREGEIDELARSCLPPGEQWQGDLPPPSPDTQWFVMAIRLPLRRVARMLTLARPDDVGVSPVTLMAIALGGQLPII